MELKTILNFMYPSRDFVYRHIEFVKEGARVAIQVEVTPDTPLEGHLLVVRREAIGQGHP